MKNKKPGLLRAFCFLYNVGKFYNIARSVSLLPLLHGTGKIILTLELSSSLGCCFAKAF